MMTESAKLDQLAAWLADASLDTDTPDDVAVIGGKLVVATLRGGPDPTLEVYEAEYAVRWHDAIAAYVRANPGCELIEAVEASRPRPAWGDKP
jgi:hypothetical protein